MALLDELRPRKVFVILIPLRVCFQQVLEDAVLCDNRTVRSTHFSQNGRIREGSMAVLGKSDRDQIGFGENVSSKLNCLLGYFFLYRVRNHSQFCTAAECGCGQSRSFRVAF